MAYINRKTFEIYASPRADDSQSDYVMVDEMLAPAIKVLNKKGYRTKYCSSGRAYGTVHEFNIDTEKNAEKLDGYLYHIVKEEPDNSCYPVTAYYFSPESNFFVIFSSATKESFTEPLPEGFSWRENYSDLPMNILEYNYKADSLSEDVFDFFKERNEACEKLYNWAKKLPFFHS